MRKSGGRKYSHFHSATFFSVQFNIWIGEWPARNTCSFFLSIYFYIYLLFSFLFYWLIYLCSCCCCFDTHLGFMSCSKPMGRSINSVRFNDHDSIARISECRKVRPVRPVAPIRDASADWFDTWWMRRESHPGDCALLAQLEVIIGRKGLLLWYRWFTVNRNGWSPSQIFRRRQVALIHSHSGGWLRWRWYRLRHFILIRYSSCDVA